MKRVFVWMTVCGLLLGGGGCKNPCKGVDCGDHGSCNADNKGSCDCETGYKQDEQGRCTEEMRAAFLGDYLGVDDCGDGANDSYFVYIETATTAGVDKITMRNIYGVANNAVTATVQSDSLLVVAAQTTPDQFEISGSGILVQTATATTITFDYIITRLSDNAKDTCSIQMTKQ